MSKRTFGCERGLMELSKRTTFLNKNVIFSNYRPRSEILIGFSPCGQIADFEALLNSRRMAHYLVVVASQNRNALPLSLIMVLALMIQNHSIAKQIPQYMIRIRCLSIGQDRGISMGAGRIFLITIPT